MIDPTHEEWLEARERAASPRGLGLDRLMENILGPCPPEPMPEPWRRSADIGTLAVAPHAYGGVCVGFAFVRQESLTPDEADAMADALIEHARYAREQEAPPSDVCGHLLEPAGRCLRPGGHIGLCRPHPLAGDDDA